MTFVIECFKKFYNNKGNVFSLNLYYTHITDHIKSSILEGSKNSDVCLVEIGGTVGDIESLPFLESIRQFRFSLESDQVMFVLLSLFQSQYLTKS